MSESTPLDFDGLSPYLRAEIKALMVLDDALDAKVVNCGCGHALVWQFCVHCGEKCKDLGYEQVMIIGDNCPGRNVPTPENPTKKRCTDDFNELKWVEVHDTKATCPKCKPKADEVGDRIEAVRKQTLQEEITKARQDPSKKSIVKALEKIMLDKLQKTAAQAKWPSGDGGPSGSKAS